METTVFELGQNYFTFKLNSQLFRIRKKVVVVFNACVVVVAVAFPFVTGIVNNIVVVVVVAANKII